MAKKPKKTYRCNKCGAISTSPWHPKGPTKDCSGVMEEYKPRPVI